MSQQCHHLAVHNQRTEVALEAIVPPTAESSYAVKRPETADKNIYLQKRTIATACVTFSRPIAFLKQRESAGQLLLVRSKNFVSNSTLNPVNSNPKFPSLPRMRGFKIAFLNICSLTCLYDELSVFMEDRTIEIIGLNETRLDNTIPDSQVDIEGYDILCRDRNRNGGGVAFYVAQSLTCVKRQDLLSHEDLEILKVEIKKNKVQAFLADNLV